MKYLSLLLLGIVLCVLLAGVYGIYFQADEEKIATEESNNSWWRELIKAPIEPTVPTIYRTPGAIQAKDIPLAEVATISNKTKTNTNAFVRKRLKALIGEELKEWTEEAGLTYPPSFVLFRTFKLEGELEVWGANNKKDALRLIKTLQTCALDQYPGPKLYEGDHKTPEGYYGLKQLIGSSLRFMWIDLERDGVDDMGEVNKGASFKLWLDYPNKVDQHRTAAWVGKDVSPGSQICMHGNCVSDGCVAFENRVYMAVYALADQHRFGNPMLYVYPFRFSEELKDYYVKQYANILDTTELRVFWENMEEGYHLFNETKRPLKVNRNGAVYKYK